MSYFFDLSHFCETVALLLSSESDLARDAFSRSLLAPWQHTRNVLQFTEAGMTLLGSIVLLNLMWKGSWIICTTVVGLLLKLVKMAILPSNSPMALLLRIIDLDYNSPNKIITDDHRCKCTTTSRFEPQTIRKYIQRALQMHAGHCSHKHIFKQDLSQRNPTQPSGENMLQFHLPPNSVDTPSPFFLTLICKFFSILHPLFHGMLLAHNVVSLFLNLFLGVLSWGMLSITLGCLYFAIEELFSGLAERELALFLIGFVFIGTTTI